MPSLTDSELAEIRSAADEHLDQVGVVRRRVDGAWFTVVAALPCRLASVGSTGGGQMRSLAGLDLNEGTILSCPVGSDVVPGDQVMIEGRRYEATYLFPREVALRRLVGTVEG